MAITGLLCISLALSRMGQVVRLGGWLVMMFSSMGYGQCIVSQTETKQLVTSCPGDTPTKSSFLVNRSDQGQSVHQTVYRGSPYLTYPVYEEGSFELGLNQPPIRGKLAFNLVSQQVSCLLPGDNTERDILPAAFTIHGKHFIARNQSTGQCRYYELVYAGKSRVLVNYSARLFLTNQGPYSVEEDYDGSYIRRERYFIELNSKPLQEVSLSKKSVLKALDTPSEENNPLTRLKDKLTLSEMIGLVARYDGFP